MNWLIFKLIVTTLSIAALIFPVSQYISFLFDNFGQAIDTARIKKSKSAIIYLMLICFVAGYIFHMTAAVIVEMIKL